MENNAPKKKQLPAFLILTIIAVVAAVVLALTNMVTAGPIAENAMAALKESFNAVMPAESYEEITVPADYEVASLYAAKNGDEVIGYCVTASGQGYGGPVAVTLGVDTQGVVAGCVVGDTSFAETAGFGMRAKEPAFQDQFPGISAVEGGSFEALSGATVTSEAVRAATNKGLRCVAEVVLGKTQEAEVTFGAPAAKEDKPAAQPLTGAVQEGSAKGFASDVKVQLTLEGGAISALTIDSSGETPGFGTRCAEDEAFINQFVGQTGPFTLGENIDALSGATVTSTAVVDAVNAALTAPAAAGAGESATGTAKGFQSDVTVTLTVENGAIASIMIASADETLGFGTRCAEDETFLNQFVGKSAPLTLGENIDALSGATVTSTAVVEAANAALANANAAEAPATLLAEGENAALAVKADGAALLTPAEGYTGDVAVNLTVEDGKVTAGEFAPAAQEEQVEEAPADTIGAEPAPADNIIGTATGFQSEVNVSITLAEDGSIAALSIGSGDETPGFGTRCAEDEAFINQFIGKTGPFAIGEGIDALSGATVTSTAVVEAINVAMNADAQAEEPAAPAAELTAAAPGFMDKDVGVTVTLNEDGTIATLTLDLSQQLPPVCDQCNSEEFLGQFIGQKGPFEGVDVVTGATFTSEGVINAVNSLFAAEEATATDLPAAELTAAAPGFMDKDVGVTVTLNGDGTIATLTLDLSQQLPPVCDQCNSEEFLGQFIGQKGPFEGVDVVTGATFTSEGVINAVNSLFQ